MVKNFMSEFYSENGTDAKEFFDLCKELDANTVYIKAKSPVLESFIQNDEENGNLIYDNNGKVGFMSLGTAIGDINEGEIVYNELKDTRSPMVKYNQAQNITAIIGNKAVSEIAALRGLHGTAISKPSKARDAYINELASGLNVTFVGRQAGDIVRVLSTRSSKYGAIPMETIEDVYKGFMSSDWIGSYEVKNWEMDQHRGAIYIEFPELANNMRAKYPSLPEKWIPGVLFENGTTGYCTLSATMTYRSPKRHEAMVVDNVAAKHFAGFSPDTFIKKMQNECWGKYTQLPQKLEAASLITIPNAEVEATLEKIFKFIRINKVFQKKDTETCRYLDNIRDKANTNLKLLMATQDITLYDIIDVVMGLPTEVIVPAAYKDLLKETCERAWTYES